VGNGGEFSMLIGEFEYRVDEKGRIPIPPKFRTEELKKEGVILCPGLEKCVNIYTLTEWKKYTESLTSGTVAPSKMRKLIRAVFSTAFNVEIDGQGRIVIPIQLRQYAGITEEVVIAGAFSYLELWSKEQWAAEKADSRNEAWQIVERMERR
jgi:MraZ protein